MHVLNKLNTLFKIIKCVLLKKKNILNQVTKENIFKRNC